MSAARSWASRALLVVAVLGTAACQASPVDVVAIDPSVLTKDLVAHWTFDEGSGSQLLDRSPHHLDGVLTGGTWIPDGRFGGALRLASGDFVSVPAFPDATPSWTVSVWMKTTAADLATLGDDIGTIIGAEAVFAGGWQMHLDHRVGSGYQQYDAAYWSGPEMMDYVVSLRKGIEADRWVPLTAVWDAPASSVTLYLDGLQVDQRPMPTAIKPGDSTLIIGTWNMKNRFFVGELDDFAVWSRALTPSEVEVLTRQPPG